MGTIAQKETTTKRPKFRFAELLGTLTVPQRRIAVGKMRDKGLTDATMSRIRNAESGDTYSPSSDSLLAIADILNVRVEDLYSKA